MCEQKRVWNQRQKQRCGCVGDTAGHVSLLCSRWDPNSISNLFELSAVFVMASQRRFGGGDPPNCEALWDHFRTLLGKVIASTRSPCRGLLQKCPELRFPFRPFRFFADLTTQELLPCTQAPSCGSVEWVATLGTHEYDGESLLASVVLTMQGVVPPMKSRGQCGPCWLFSRGSLEERRP